MPYKRVPPAAEYMMDKDRYKDHYSICQKLRDIYHMTDDPELKLNARICMTMAKKMQNKLKYYGTMLNKLNEEEIKEELEGE
jgi:hypothetical protein